tara:strand:+ start:2875 stop:3882 length:1008 start_codon:yes stop_codon:yes gene_type:complete
MSKIVELIDEFHRKTTDTQRGHMGGSILGHQCERYLWYMFRWTFKENFPGRIRRLFRRGHNEEHTIVSDLRKIGIDIRDVGNNQARVEFGSHVSGSIDGVIKSGVPGHETEQFIAEFKTHNQKSFDGVARKGVQVSKPAHYAQMQVYMLGKKIHKSLYIAINKNNDEMYTEIVEFDKECAERLLRKGEWISLADEAPPRISKDPTWFACKFCPAKHICHSGEPTKQINCRTCAHSEPKPNGTWTCNRHNADNIPEDFQHKGCEDHILHRDVVPWTRMGGDDPNVVTFEINGEFIKNGKCKDGYASSELVSNIDACMSKDEFIGNLRSDFGGKISG